VHIGKAVDCNFHEDQRTVFIGEFSSIAPHLPRQKAGILVAMAFVPALIIPAMSAARVLRNSSSDERDGAPLAASDVRKQGVVDRMVSGSSPPVSYWSAKELEKMIKTNSAFRDRAEELRSAHAKANGRGKLAEVPNALMGA